MDSHETNSADKTAKKPAKKKGLVIALSVLLVALLGGGGYFFMAKKTHPTEQDEHAEAGEGDDGHGEKHEDAHAAQHEDAHGDAHGAKNDDAHGEKSHAKKSGHGDAHASAKSHDGDDDDDEEAGESHPADHGKKSTAKGHGAKGQVAKDNVDAEKKTLLGKVVEAFENIHDKVVGMHHAEVNNERLKLENMNLRQQLERLRYEGQGNEALKFTKDLEMKLSEEAGTKVARTLASIRYKPPEHLLPVQLYTLAVTYFKGREDEKAAVLLTYLTGLEENDAFKNSKNYLMTGVTWYRLDHFELADYYLKKVLELPKNRENQAFQAQARLWKGILSERQGKHVSAQNWLKELVDNHPHSREAGWVNGGVPAVYLDGRSTASTPNSRSGLNEVDHDEAEEDDEEE